MKLFGVILFQHFELSYSLHSEQAAVVNLEMGPNTGGLVVFVLLEDLFHSIDAYLRYVQQAHAPAHKKAWNIEEVDSNRKAKYKSM